MVTSEKYRLTLIDKWSLQGKYLDLVDKPIFKFYNKWFISFLSPVSREIILEEGKAKWGYESYDKKQLGFFFNNKETLDMFLRLYINDEVSLKDNINLAKEENPDAEKIDIKKLKQSHERNLLTIGEILKNKEDQTSIKLTKDEFTQEVSFNFQKEITSSEFNNARYQEIEDEIDFILKVSGGNKEDIEDSKEFSTEKEIIRKIKEKKKTKAKRATITNKQDTVEFAPLVKEKKVLEKFKEEEYQKRIKLNNASILGDAKVQKNIDNAKTVERENKTINKYSTQNSVDKSEAMIIIREKVDALFKEAKANKKTLLANKSYAAKLTKETEDVRKQKEKYYEDTVNVDETTKETMFRNSSVINNFSKKEALLSFGILGEKDSIPSEFSKLINKQREIFIKINEFQNIDKFFFGYIKPKVKNVNSNT